MRGAAWLWLQPAPSPMIPKASSQAGKNPHRATPLTSARPCRESPLFPARLVRKTIFLPKHGKQSFCMSALLSCESLQGEGHLVMKFHPRNCFPLY